jgi:peptidoglycan/LPS O-acetylase OafA/YrhL
MSESPPGPRRLAALDGLRGVAAVGVVVLHVWFYTDDGNPLTNVGDALMQGLRLGVTLFFVLSGLLLILPWVRAVSAERKPPDLRTYVLRRAARILPAYYLALAGAAVIVAFANTKLLPSGTQAGALVAMVQNWLPAAAHKLDPPAWSLAVEISFYVLVPLFGIVTVRRLRTAKRQLAGCAALVALSLVANVLITRFGPQAWHRTFPALLYAFAFGMAIAVPLAHGLRPGVRARLALISIGTTLVVLDAFAHEPLRLRGYLTWQDVPAAAGFALIVYAVAAADHSPVLSVAPVRWIGERSYGLYLWHYPVLVALTGAGLLPGSTLLASIVTVGLALIPAALSWRFVELPILERARRLSDARHRRRAHLHRTGSSRASANASNRPRVALARHAG